jgi:ACT domain
VRYAVRVSLPDRPGSLSAVTAALGRMGADIVLLEVVDRSDGTAVDDLYLETDGDRRDLRVTLEQVEGVFVESLRAVRRFPDAGGPMNLAARLVELGRGAVPELVAGVPGALSASWAVALGTGVRGIDVLAVSANAPDLTGIDVPWLPLLSPRRLLSAEWMPPSWRDDIVSGLELAAVPLGSSGAGLLVARRDGPRFRSNELRMIADLARIAVAAEVMAPRLRTAGTPIAATRY